MMSFNDDAELLTKQNGPPRTTLNRFNNLSASPIITVALLPITHSALATPFTNLTKKNGQFSFACN
jgi:hypothetical protein